MQLSLPRSAVNVSTEDWIALRGRAAAGIHEEGLAKGHGSERTQGRIEM